MSGQENPDSLIIPMALAESLVDDSDCCFDHHGGCQSHGYLSLRLDELCPQAELKIIIAGADPANPYKGWEDAEDTVCESTCPHPCLALPENTATPDE